MAQNDVASSSQSTRSASLFLSSAIWTNHFTLLAISTLFCFLVFVLSVIDHTIITVYYPAIAVLTFTHHAVLVVLYRRHGGVPYFSGKEAPAIFIAFPNLILLFLLSVFWGFSAVFGAIMASFNSQQRNAIFMSPLAIFSPISSLYPRLVICATLSSVEVVIMEVLIIKSIMQRRLAVRRSRETTKTNDIPLSPL